VRPRLSTIVYLAIWIGALVLVVIAESWFVSLAAVLIVGSIALLVRPSIETLRAFVGYFRWLLVVLAFVVGSLAVGVDPKAQPEFFSVSAQIIPVLLLAIALEARMLGTMRDKTDLVLAVFVVSFLALGEFFALRAVAHGSGDGEAVSVVAGAIAAGFAGILVGAFGLPPAAPARDGDALDVPRTEGGPGPAASRTP
jgi:hypothetical protein